MTEQVSDIFEEQFVRRLASLTTADRTALKRSLGLSLQEADAKAWSAFYKVYLKDHAWEEGISFMVACAASAFQNCPGPQRPFPNRLRELSQQSSGIESRLLQLLDIPLQPNAYFAAKLGRLLRFLLAQGMNVDFVSLLKDLKRWDHPDRYIQLRWARIFYGYQEQKQEEE